MELSKLQEEVSDWSIRNFGDDPAHRLRPLLGACEEMGELALVAVNGTPLLDDETACIADLLVAQALLGRLCHYVLKSAQGIRGHSPERIKHLSLAADRLISFLNGIFVEENLERFPYEEPTDEELPALRTDAVGDILVYLADYCRRDGLDLNEALETTWARVSQRNWQADPQKGGEP